MPTGGVNIARMGSFTAGQQSGGEKQRSMQLPVALEQVAERVFQRENFWDMCSLQDQSFLIVTVMSQ